MAREPRRGSEGAPQELPQGSPRDLHPTSDIRFVIVEVAKLTERIDHLIDRHSELKSDAKETHGKLIEIEKSISFVRGAIWVFGGIFALALVILGAVVAWKLHN